MHTNEYKTPEYAPWCRYQDSLTVSCKEQEEKAIAVIKGKL